MAHGKDVSGNRAQVSNPSADTAIPRQSLAENADPRLAVFCADEGPEVFRSVFHRHEIWREDPFVVRTGRSSGGWFRGPIPSGPSKHWAA